MSDTSVILLAFANDRQGQFLRSISEENQLINEMLAPAEKAKFCEIITLPAADIDAIIDKIKEVRGRLKVFHYGGHADGYNLLLSSGEAEESVDAKAFAKFLGTQDSIELVFLNGCSTENQAKELIAAGIPQVIVTNQDIVDEVARDFARQFYQSLADGQTIAQCFAEAESGTMAKHGGDTRSFSFKDDDEEEKEAPKDEDKFPWLLETHPSAKSDWTIKEREVDLIVAKVQKQIVNNNLDIALKIMARYLKSKDQHKSDLYKRLIAAHNRIESLEEDAIDGLIDYGEKSKEMARIRKQIIELLGKLSDGAGNPEEMIDPFD